MVMSFAGTISGIGEAGAGRVVRLTAAPRPGGCARRWPKTVPRGGRGRAGRSPGRGRVLRQLRPAGAVEVLLGSPDRDPVRVRAEAEDCLQGEHRGDADTTPAALSVGAPCPPRAP